jgi:hypothetical protein
MNENIAASIAQAVQMARVAGYFCMKYKSNWTSIPLSGIITSLVLRVTKYSCHEVEEAIERG